MHDAVRTIYFIKFIIILLIFARGISVASYYWKHVNQPVKRSKITLNRIRFTIINYYNNLLY